MWKLRLFSKIFMGKHFKTSLRLLTCYSLDKVKNSLRLNHTKGSPSCLYLDITRIAMGVIQGSIQRF